MTISAQVIADSVNEGGDRLTTLRLRYPRFIHPEVLTHRAFSRNSSSSRAIPVERLIDDVLNDTAMPIHWGKNQPGMQAREEHNARLTWPTLTGHFKEGDAEQAWIEARDRAVDMARRYAAAGYHKQVVNRILEPFAHINVVVTATDWDNWFELRDHEDAQPEIQQLARVMRITMRSSEPRLLREGEWHLPFVGGDEDPSREVSAARCARVSYLTHDGKKPSYEADLKLFQKLAGSRPFHASPLEHQATPAKGRHRNLHGWKSFRAELGV